MQLLGLSTVDLANSAAVARGTVSHALNGRRIHPMKLRAIAKALDELEPIPGVDGLIDEDGLEGSGEADGG
jgi:hypothetical protein